jgi:hypothetical protein
MKRIIAKILPVLAFLTTVFAPRVCAARTSSLAGDPSVKGVSAVPTRPEKVSMPLISCEFSPERRGSEVTLSSAAMPLSLTRADFTGDGNPDIAAIELDRPDAISERYRIEIRLTEGREQFLEVLGAVAPVSIAAEDVTGHGTLDIVLWADGRDIPVAVFLNDGCGHFKAESTFSLRKLQNPNSNSHFGAEHEHGVSAALSTGSYTTARPSRLRHTTHSGRGFLIFAGNQAALQILLLSSSDRAPPLHV